LANELKRGQRNVLTSSTATISRMGVVSPTIPQISEYTNMISKQLSNLAEVQAKSIDADYLTNYDINTTKFITEKTNAILNSQDEPDLVKFQTELESYYSAIEKDSPQRLKSQIQQTFFNKYLNSIEHVKNHANNVKFNKSGENFELSKANVFDYLGFEIDNIIKTQDQNMWMGSLEKLFSKDATPELFKLASLYDNHVNLSMGKLNDSNKDAMHKSIMVDAESLRLKGVLKMLALSNPDNFEEIGSQYLLEYKLNKNDRRAVNYDIFGEISDTVVDGVINNAKNELSTLVNLNKDAQASKIAADKLALLQNYNTFTTSIKDLTNGFVMMNNDNKPITEIDLSVMGFSDSQAIKLVELNNAKMQVVDLLREARTTDIPLAQLLENSTYEQSISLLGGKDAIIKQYYETELGLKDDISTYQSDMNDLNLQNMLQQINKNQVAPPGYVAFLNSATNTPFLKEATFVEVKDAIMSAFPTWNVATDGGSIDIKNIPADVNKIMKEVLSMQEDGFTYDQIANNIQKDLNLSGTEKAQKTKKTDRYLEEYPIDVGNVIYQAYQSYSDNYKRVDLNGKTILGTEENIVEGFSPMLPKSWWNDLNDMLFEIPGSGTGFDPITLINKGLNKLKAATYGDDFEDEFMKHYENIFRNSVSFNDDQAALEKKSQAAGYEAMKVMAGMGYGYSEYMSPDGEGSFQKYSLESVFGGDNRHLQDYGAGFILGQIIEYEKAGQTQELINMGFVDYDGNYIRPTAQQVLEMLDDGKFYFTWDGEEPGKVGGKANNVRYDLFYNNYEDLQGRASVLTSKPIFQFDPNNKFNPNYYTSDINIDKLKYSLANDATKLLPDNSPVREFVTKYQSLGTAYVWDFITKIAPGERKNIFDEKMVNDIAILEQDLKFKTGKVLREMFSNAPYKTLGDKLVSFDNYFRNVNIATSGNPAPVPFDTDKATTIINEVDSVFEDLGGFEKTIISEVLYSMPDINKNDLFKAIKKRDFKKINKLIGMDKGTLIEGMLYTPEIFQQWKP